MFNPIHRSSQMPTDYKHVGENREGLAASDGSEPGENPAEFRNGTAGPPPDRADLFLSPHSDDVCFSLGDLARRRQAGTLLTIFSRSQYIAVARANASGSADEITAERLAEDAAFASACGLITESLGLRDAPMRGCLPFKLENLAIEAQALEPVLFDQMLLLGRRKPVGRPWLFCPSGIGGHIDHVAVMTVVARNIDMLQQIYRVCFYEDLHYASKILARSTGLHRLAQNLPEHTLIRRQWQIAEAEKLNLIRLYASQFAVAPTSVEQFIPAIYVGQAPHEAVWTVQRRKQ